MAKPSESTSNSPPPNPSPTSPTGCSRSQIKPACASPSAGPPAQSPLACGQQLRAVLRILPPETFHDPGIWSRAVYLESQQITASASILATKRDGDQPRLTLLGQPQANSIPCLLNRARDAASNRLETLPALTRNLPRFLRATPEDAAMLTALLTGDRTFLTRSLRAGFERTGSFHLIVVSGLHLAILAGCVFAIARRMRLTRLPATALTLQSRSPTPSSPASPSLPSARSG
jgi:competence protein ComEC